MTDAPTTLHITTRVPIDVDGRTHKFARCQVALGCSVTSCLASGTAPLR